MSAPTAKTLNHVVETVIVPLDGSDRAERAIPPAASIAKAYGAHLLFVTTRWDNDAEDPRRYMHSIIEEAGLIGVESIVIHDRLASEAIELVAHESHAPLVCMTTHGRSGLGQAVLGSVAERVVRHVRCPLMLLGPRVTGTASRLSDRLVVGVDHRPQSRGVLAAAASWANVAGAPIDVVSVLRPDRDEGEARSVLDDAVAELQREIPEAAAGRITPVLLRGRLVAPAIVDHAVFVDAGAIALTTHAREGLARVALGSVTIAVVRDAPCGVLVVGPAAVEPALD